MSSPSGSIDVRLTHAHTEVWLYDEAWLYEISTSGGHILTWSNILDFRVDEIFTVDKGVLVDYMRVHVGLRMAGGGKR